MITHPFQKPFRTAFVEKKRTIRQSLNSRDNILEDIAKFGDLFAGEHIPRVRPELVARINEKLVFNRLPYAIQRKICELITREVERLNSLGYSLVVASETVELLVREGFHRALGARPMRNTVDRYLQQYVSQTLLKPG